MGDADFDVGAFFEHAAGEQHGSDDGVIKDHAEAVVETVAADAFLQEIIARLRVVEQHCAQLLGRLEKRQESGFVPLQAVDAGVQRRPLEAQCGDGAFEFSDRQPHVLHRQCCKPGQAAVAAAHCRAEFVVEIPRQRQALRRLQVITDKGCVDGQYLHVDFLLVHVLDALLHRVAQLG